MTDPTGQDGNVSSEPMFIDVAAALPMDWDLHLEAGSPLVDIGSVDLEDPDGSRADMGPYGGPNADGWDLDRDGYPSWWQPGPYDAVHHPAEGWDCDDLDDAVTPASGC